MMLRPVRMAQIDCMVYTGKKDEVVRALHKNAVAQLDYASDDTLEKNKLGRGVAAERVTEVSERIFLLSKLIDTLSPHHSQKTSFVTDMLSVDTREKIPVKDLSFSELLKDADEYATAVDFKVRELSSALTDAESRLREAEAEVSLLSPFTKTDFDLSVLGESGILYATAGILPKNSHDTLADDLDGELNRLWHVEVFEQTSSGVPVVVSTVKDNAEKLSALLRKRGFTPSKISSDGGIKKRVISLEKTINESRSKITETRGKFAGIASESLRQLTARLELLKFEKERCEVFTKGGETEKISYLKLYAPLRDVSKIESTIEEASDGYCYLDVDRNPADAPTLLENPKVFRSFEMLTKLFSPPKYNQLDPTMLLAPGFVVFFGLMLTDAVYGISLIIMAWLIRRNYGRYSQGLTDMTTIILLCGISAIFFGLLTGSILGDLVGKYVLGGEGSQTVAIWLDPLYQDNAITFLVFMCLLGLMHLYLGYLVGAFDELRQGNKKKAITHYLSWYILLFGGILFAFNHTLTGTAAALTALALLFSAHGFMVFVNLIGLVGNTLSYARLLAMGLTTAGIAMTFNFLAGMAYEIPYLGILVAALIFIAGHVINILINALGAFVHALRLNYVEFFGAFYEGGGVEYTPFAEARKITEVSK